MHFRKELELKRLQRYFVALATTLALSLPVCLVVGSTARTGLHTTYRQAASNLRGQLDLSPRQHQALDNLFALSEEQERHLRKQMRTTYTPAQQRMARRLWQERKGRPLTPEQRQQLRAQLRVTSDQEAQFQIYEARLREHREETLEQAYALIGPEKKPLLIGALDDFQQL